MRLGEWGADVLDLLLPAGCMACRSWIPGGREAPLVCARCRSLLREAPWPRCPRCHHPRGTGRPEGDACPECEAWPEALTAARHAYALGTPSEDLVHALKYEGWPELAEPMGDAVAQLVPDRRGPGGRPRIVVPIPTTEERVRSRGYNQAELLARRVAQRSRLPLVHALTRVGARRSQTALTPSERLANVRGAFRPAGSAHSEIRPQARPRVGPGVGPEVRSGPASKAPVDESVRGADVLLVDDVLTTGATASEAACVLADMGAATVTLLTYARALSTGPEKAR